MAARKFSPEFKKRVVLEFEAGDKKASQICREQDISDSLLVWMVEPKARRQIEALLLSRQALYRSLPLATAE